MSCQFPYNKEWRKTDIIYRTKGKQKIGEKMVIVRRKESERKAKEKVVAWGISLVLLVVIFGYGCWEYISNNGYRSRGFLIVVITVVTTLMAVVMFVRYNNASGRVGEKINEALGVIAGLSFLILIGLGLCVGILDILFHNYGYVLTESWLKILTIVLMTDAFVFAVSHLLNKYS